MLNYDIESDWDLSSCIENNFDDKLSFEEIKNVLAHVPGEHDGSAYWWVLELKNGDFGLLCGGCDFSGWE